MNTPSESIGKTTESEALPGGQATKKTGASWNRGAQRGQSSAVIYSFEGTKTEIGAVLGLKHEKMKHKVIFDDFIEKFTNYLTSNMTGARDVVKTILDRDNMMERIDEDITEDLTLEEAASAVRVLLKTEEVKKFGARKQLAKDNAVEAFGLI